MERGGLGLAQRVMCLDWVSISHIEISLLPLIADTTQEPSLGCILTRRTAASGSYRWLIHFAQKFAGNKIQISKQDKV